MVELVLVTRAGVRGSGWTNIRPMVYPTIHLWAPRHLWVPSLYWQQLELGTSMDKVLGVMGWWGVAGEYHTEYHSRE